MHLNRHRHRQGFTLIEVLVASLILGITVAAISQVMGTGIRAWRNGHGVSEVGQTVRIAQDMIVRDLDNLYFQSESSYNRAFYTQISGISARFGAQFSQDKNLNGLQNAINEALTGRKSHQGRKRKIGQDGQGDALDDFSLESIAPPLNLSFHGGETQLSFARGYRARYPGDQDTWGLRRVSYYVRDKVLYRKEEAPYGLRMAGGGDTAAAAASSDPNNPVLLIQNQLQQLFAVRDETAQESQGAGEAGQQDSESSGTSLLPTAVRIDEPLCAGVEIFKIKYGYFSNGSWIEDQNWDSQARAHRCPPQDDLNGPNASANLLNQNNLPQFIAQSIQQAMAPDDLPGFIAIQLGLRQPNGKGRLYSFTIYHSMPGAREIDVFRDDRGTGGIRR